MHTREHSLISRRRLVVYECSVQDGRQESQGKVGFVLSAMQELFDTNPTTSRHKPKLAVTFSKELQAVDGLDISNDSEEMHPPSLCRCCVLKLERFKKSRNRNDRQLKFPGDKGKCCVFLTHDSYMKEGSCPICCFNLRQSPRKKRPHESDHSPSASGNASENSERAAAGG